MQKLEILFKYWIIPCSMKTWRPNEPDLESQIHTLSMCSEFPLTDLHTPKAQSFPSQILIFSRCRLVFFSFPPLNMHIFPPYEGNLLPKMRPGNLGPYLPLTAITHLGVSLTQNPKRIGARLILRDSFR